MKKLMTAVLMLFILTVLVSGASASPVKGSSSHGSASLYGYTSAYGTSSSEGSSYAATSASTEVSTDHKGRTVEGTTQAYVYGGPGSGAYSSQIVSGSLF